MLLLEMFRDYRCFFGGDVARDYTVYMCSFLQAIKYVYFSEDNFRDCRSKKQSRHLILPKACWEDGRKRLGIPAKILLAQVNMSL